MTKKDKVTPLQAARAYAAEHPEFEGAIDVTVLRPKGRGGWGTTKNTARVWAREGKAALSKHPRRSFSIWMWNGHCQACGRVHLEPVLGQVYRDDERAGQPLGPENADKRDYFERQWAHYWNTWGEARREPVYAPRCSIYGVCAACATSLGMEDEARWPRALEVNELECAPAGFVAKPEPPVVVIDLTKREATKEHERTGEASAAAGNAPIRSGAAEWNSACINEEEAAKLRRATDDDIPF